ncbi:unnamed protein product, partial [Ectocarpus sp. 12 AP-2014]
EGDASPSDVDSGPKWQRRVLGIVFLFVLIVSVLDILPTLCRVANKSFRVRSTVKYIYFKSFVLVQVKTFQPGVWEVFFVQPVRLLVSRGGFIVRGGKVLD